MKERIEFGYLKMGDVAKRHIDDVIKSNHVSFGPKVQMFEEEFGKLFNYKHTVAVSTGTDAVFNALLTLYDFGADKDTEIIVPALSFIATSTAVRMAGFKPVWVDVRASDLNINEELVEDAITPKTKAILVVSTMGRPPKMDRLREIADKHKLLLICDNAEGHGCKFNGKFMGEIADMSTYSFFAAHLIICGGEGGAVATNRNDLAEILKSTRTHGRAGGKAYFTHDRYGANSKLSDLSAAVGLEGIGNFWTNFHCRKWIYYTLMSELNYLSDKCYFSEEDNSVMQIAPHGFSITLKEPDDLQFKRLISSLDDENIHWKRNFGAVPDHLAFAYMKQRDLFPQATFAGNYGIHIGLSQYYTVLDIIRIISAIRRAFA